MPIYEVEAPDGRILEIEGDQFPSEQELDNIFASVGSNKQPQQPDYKQMSLKEVFNATPDELNENMKALGRQRLQQRADWEQAHPFISEFQKAFQPHYRANLIDMQNQAEYGMQVPLGQRIKSDFQKAGQNLVPSVNIVTTALTGKPIAMGKGLLPAVGKAALQGSIQGGVEGLTGGLADEGLSVNALKRGLQGAEIGGSVAGAIQTIPYFGKPIAKALDTPQVQNAITSGLELLTSVPKKYSDLALKAELAGKSILGGKFNPETAYQGVERKLRTAKGMLPTDKQYKEQYKQLGNQVREKLKQLNLSETYFDNKYSEIGKNAYENLQNLRKIRGQAVGEAVENLDPNINFNVDELQKVLDDVYNKFSVSGVQGLNVARNTVKDVYDNVQNLINLGKKTKEENILDLINQSKINTETNKNVIKELDKTIKEEKANSLKIAKQVLKQATGYKNVNKKILNSSKGIDRLDTAYASDNITAAPELVREHPELFGSVDFGEYGVDEKIIERAEDILNKGGVSETELIANQYPNFSNEYNIFNNILDDIKRNPESILINDNISNVENILNNLSIPNDLKVDMFEKLYKIYGEVGDFNTNKNTITPKELKDILNNISDYPINWNDSTAKVRQNILKQLYGGYSNLLKQKSPELAKANQSFAEISSALNNIGNPERARLVEQIRNYASNAGKQIRSGENVALEEINNILPKEQQFLQNAINLQANKNAQDLLNKNISEGILNDISKYQNAPYATQEALERVAPEQVEQFAKLLNEQTTQKDILQPISAKAFERNPRLLSNRNDVATEEALAYLQERSGINFMDELEEIRAREALEAISPGQGGGSGGGQGFLNNVARPLLINIGKGTSGALIGSSLGGPLGAAIGLLAVSPKIMAKGTIQKLGRLYRGLENPNVNSLRQIAVPLSVPTLYGGVVYNKDRE